MLGPDMWMPNPPFSIVPSTFTREPALATHLLRRYTSPLSVTSS